MNLGLTFHDVHGSVCIDQMFKRHHIQNITEHYWPFYYFFDEVVNFVFLILCFVSIYPQTLKCGCMKLTTFQNNVGEHKPLCRGFQFHRFSAFPPDVSAAVAASCTVSRSTVPAGVHSSLISERRQWPKMSKWCLGCQLPTLAKSLGGVKKSAVFIFQSYS